MHLQVFAPLARLLGLYSIKEELEALSFRYSNPDEYALVQRRLDALAKDQEDVVLKVNFWTIYFVRKCPMLSAVLSPSKGFAALQHCSARLIARCHSHSIFTK